MGGLSSPSSAAASIFSTTPRKSGRRAAGLLLLTGAFLLRGVFLSLALPYGEPLDEPFHLGYASFLAWSGRPPSVGEPSIPFEVLRPFHYLPHSASLGPRISWREFDALTVEDRARRRDLAFRRDPAEASAPAAPNYEAQQPPAAYVPAAWTLRFFRGLPLDRRLLVLRLGATAIAALTVPLAFLFFRRLFPRRAALAATAAFTAFPGVGWWVGRWTNDAVALPIGAALIVGMADLGRGRLSRVRAGALTLLLALGCWVKLYFLLFLPAVPLAALSASAVRRGAVFRRALASSVIAFLLIVPWLAHQRAATGDWLGLLPSRQAAAAGVSLFDRARALPGVARGRYAIVFGRTFLWPGTWGAMGAPAVLAVPLAAVLAALALGPLARARPRSPLRRRLWRSAATSLLFFALGYLAYATTFAAVARRGGYRPSAGPDGWYLLLLLPLILTLGCWSGRRIALPAMITASFVFLAADLLLALGTVPAVYAGRVEPNGANAPWSAWLPMALSPKAVFHTYEALGLARAPSALIAGVWVAMLICLIAGLWSCRPAPKRPR